jgi:uncharacterized repeat protein (TIGR03803 family)
MKTQNLFLALLGLVMAAAMKLPAQTFTTLYKFSAAPFSTNSDGANPYGGLILSDSTLYGTARNGGSPVYGNGTVFKVNTDGTSFTNLHTFAAIPLGYSTNSDGANPYAGLILSSNTLFGTTYKGGSSSNGTVFRMNTDGTGFTNLHTFTAFFGYINADGANPYGGLILLDNTLYGTAQNGGGLGSGTLFAINTDGTGFIPLHTFSARSAAPQYTNYDGAYPSGSLVLSGNTLYGTAGSGGYSGMGAVFKINIDSGSFTNLTGNNVAYPSGSLILSGSTLYGTSGGGNSGTLFKVNTDGTGCTNFYRFTATFNPNYTNRDGASPIGGLILSGNTLYGTANGGGFYAAGTVFAINTNGTAFANLHNFTGSDGAFPWAGLILSGSTLYGTTLGGGISPGNGTVFSLSLVTAPQLPQLTIIPFGANVILTWPTNAAGFTLQSTTNLVSPAVWSTVSPGPVVLNGQNTVLNPVSGTQQFYRLSH